MRRGEGETETKTETEIKIKTERENPLWDTLTPVCVCVLYVCVDV